MIARLILGAVGLLSIGIVGWFGRFKFKKYAKAFYSWSAGTSEFWGRAETFLNETAVLWFVFPTLDTLYERSNDRPSPTVTAVLVSYAVALFAFFAAVYSEKKRVELEKREEKEGG